MSRVGDMPRLPSNSQRKLLTIQILIAMLSTCDEELFLRSWYGFKLERLIHSKTFGKGKGKGPRRKKNYNRFEAVDVFENIKNNPSKLEKLIHLNVDEFEILISVLIKNLVRDKLGLSLIIYLYLLKF
jgi:hypothetical protein